MTQDPRAQGGYTDPYSQPNFGQGPQPANGQNPSGQQPPAGQVPYGQPGGGYSQNPYAPTGGSASPYAQPGEPSGQNPYAPTGGGAQQPYGQPTAPQPGPGDSAQPNGYGAPASYAGVQPYQPTGYDAQHPARPAMGLVPAIKAFFKNYATFYGRAGRGEYWWPWLAFFVLSSALSTTWAPDMMTALLHHSAPAAGSSLMQLVQSLIGLALLAPCIGVTVRRLHDTGRSGWWALLALIFLIGQIILLVFLAGRSKPTGVRYDNPDGSQPSVG